MREVTDDAPAGTDPETKIDLSGIPAQLHDVFRVLARADPKDSELLAEREAASRVLPNKDGSVIVNLSRPVRIGDEEHERLRLRPLKARDYFDGTASDAQDVSLAATLRFASRIAKPAGIVDELATIADVNAVYFGVMVARKNFSSPRP